MSNQFINNYYAENKIERSAKLILVGVIVMILIAVNFSLAEQKELIKFVTLRTTNSS